MAGQAATHRTRPLLELELEGDGEWVRAVRQAAPAARVNVDAQESEGQSASRLAYL